MADETQSWLLLLSILFCSAIAVWQMTSHGQIGANTSKIDKAVIRIRSVEEKLTVQPADVLNEVRAAREEFRSSRFTHADGVRMSERIDRIVELNQLKEGAK